MSTNLAPGSGTPTPSQGAQRVEALMGAYGNSTQLRAKYIQWRLADIGNGGDGAWNRFQDWLGSPEQGKGTAPALQNMPGVTQADIDQWAGVAAAPAGPGQEDVTGPTADAIQVHFNNGVVLSQQAIAIHRDQGFSPLMKWDPFAYGKGPDGKGIGGFVATSTLVPTLAAVNQQFSINRAQIDQVARTMYQTGRAPRLTLNERGMLVLQVDANGNPTFDETVENRAQRLSATTAAGFVPYDLMAPPKAAGPAAANRTPGAPGAEGVAGTRGAEDAKQAAGIQPTTNAGETWASIGDDARKQFVGTWGEPLAQARWEWEESRRKGENPGTFRAYAQMRGVPEADLPPEGADDAAPANAGATETPAGVSSIGGDHIASDGLKFSEQPPEVQQQYTQQFGGDADSAAIAWGAEHERDLTQPGWRDSLGGGEGSPDLTKPLAQQWLERATGILQGKKRTPPANRGV